MSFSVNSWREGTAWNAWEYFGCHRENGETVFRVWAPGARAVYVTGSFCGWDPHRHIAEEIAPDIYQCALSGISQYETYKYVLITEDGTELYKSDPFAFHAETPPANASKVYILPEYEWNDQKWMAKRRNGEQPLSIYQVHAGSFRTYANGDALNYRKLGEELVSYQKVLGFTHLGLMPLTEHQDTASGGRNPNGFFALTSRYGVPRDFCRMVELMHQADSGVIMDFCPLGFPKDDFGLSSFTGRRCYERDCRNNWCFFDFEKPEVRSFLLSSAAFLLQNFHLDGLRVLYAEEIARHPGGIGFLQDFCRQLLERFPDIILAGSVEEAGFNRILDSVSCGAAAALACGLDTALPVPRSNRIQQVDLDLTGTETLIARMPGSYDEKFSRLRAVLAFLMALPGGKLWLMGNEFAQFEAWSPWHELDWVLLDYDMHRRFLAMCQRLSDFYRKTAAIWEETPMEEHFRMIQTDPAQGVRAFVRKDSAGNLIFVLANFSDQPVSPFVLGVEKRGKYAELFSTDEIQYGGEGRASGVNFARLRPADGQPYCIEAELPPRSTVYLYKAAGIK